MKYHVVEVIDSSKDYSMFVIEPKNFIRRMFFVPTSNHMEVFSFNNNNSFFQSQCDALEKIKNKFNRLTSPKTITKYEIDL